MDKTECLIITSIAGSDNKILAGYAQLCAEKNIGFILAGDSKSPKNFDLPGCEYLSVETQNKLPFTLPKLIPNNRYSKKNIAYLQAIKKGYKVIIETDDDNLPLDEFLTTRNVMKKGDFLEDKNWVNTYAYFSDDLIWPRGFPLNKILEPAPEIKGVIQDSYFCPIQQGLADENPDVDALYRLTRKLPVYFKKREPVILGYKSICPFNSQNTTWFKQSFPLLYLPSYCSFRMTDIWRSFIAQRILWENNWNLAFHNATVYQQRNVHDLKKDFEEEMPGYLNNSEMVEELLKLNLKAGENNIPANLILCYDALVNKNFIDKKEMDLLVAWLSDLETLALE